MCMCVHTGTSENVQAVLNSKALPVLIRGELLLHVHVHVYRCELQKSCTGLHLRILTGGGSYCEK